jgi:mannose-6-phosphate isomerase-like protein (cupin superfamily)
MFVSSLWERDEFIAADGSILRELLHPDKADLAIRYSLAHARVPSGQTTAPHRLKTAEVYYILEGSGLMFIDDESSPVGPGCTIYIPPGSTQCIRNIDEEDLVFLCIVDPAWRREDEEVL